MQNYQGEHYRARADQLRALAKQVSDPDCRRQMEELAVRYVCMAENSEDRRMSAMG